jgi:hypothetical protein
MTNETCTTLTGNQIQTEEMIKKIKEQKKEKRKRNATGFNWSSFDEENDTGIM